MFTETCWQCNYHSIVCLRLCEGGAGILLNDREEISGYFDYLNTNIRLMAHEMKMLLEMEMQEHL